MKKMSFPQALRRTVFYRIKETLGLQHLPVKLRIALTQRCNARCKTCNAWKDRENASDEMSAEQIERIFRKNAAFFRAVRQISLTGGEPSLRRDLPDILRAISARLPAATINVNTNGLLADRILEMAQAAAESGILVTWNVSLDALDETHDRMRGVPRAVGNARAILEGLVQSRKKGLKIKAGVNHMITEESCRQTPDVYAYAHSLGVSFNPIMPTTGEIYNNEADSFDLSAESRESLIAFFEHLIRDFSGDFLRHSEILSQLRGLPRDFNCWAGRILFLIEENADVFPNGGCPATWRLGNLRDFDFSFPLLLAGATARSVLRQTIRCRHCRLSCETLTTLKFPEALVGRHKMAGCNSA